LKIRLFVLGSLFNIAIVFSDTFICRGWTSVNVLRKRWIKEIIEGKKSKLEEENLIFLPKFIEEPIQQIIREKKELGYQSVEDFIYYDYAIRQFFKW